MRLSVVLAFPCRCTQDALRGGRKSEQGASLGARGAVVSRWWVTVESWPSSDIAKPVQKAKSPPQTALGHDRVPSYVLRGGCPRHRQRALTEIERVWALRSND